ncbi:hypothetical protein PPERSA_05825 [Pseudocohnilembus persalinus]|uniref:AB hydrolase-1 domain-containing protein n=1 Tax=Pseudocohnilembus persalinus TaxID=266149 RepID=A0A0V0QGE6_PSEPJ|nr:hypothetical protein PPERSA_05825 [Pseudocohnilembus persalinus]|eukprot:KRX01239.1 hypothetical protein PPERSA_05825 [Pseudocohnilembus persalinus]
MGLYGIVYEQKSKTYLIYDENDLNKQILENCTSLYKYRPSLYLINGVLQAWYGSNDTLIDQNVRYEQQYIDIINKGKFLIEWGYLDTNEMNNQEKQNLHAQQLKNQNKLIVVIPGVTASREEPYILNMISESLHQGFKVVLVNDRLYSRNSPAFHLNADNYYCYLEDLAGVINYIFQNTKYDEYYAIGHSLGANTLVRYLGSDHQNKFNAAISVANPWDLIAVSKNLSGFYDQYILQNRLHIMEQKKSDIEKQLSKITQYSINLNECMQSKTSMQFDDCFTKFVLGNYKHMDEYFDYMASHKVINNIDIPLLCLQSKDDPICNWESVPFDKFSQNKNVVLWISETGGHIGWYQGLYKPQRWYMKPCLEFINFISQNQNKNQNQGQIINRFSDKINQNQKYNNFLGQKKEMMIQN